MFHFATINIKKIEKTNILRYSLLHIIHTLIQLTNLSHPMYRVVNPTTFYQYVWWTHAEGRNDVFTDKGMVVFEVNADDQKEAQKEALSKFTHDQSYAVCPECNLPHFFLGGFVHSTLIPRMFDKAGEDTCADDLMFGIALYYKHNLTQFPKCRIYLIDGTELTLKQDLFTIRNKDDADVKELQYKEIVSM
jgi:hypothetical protein